MSAEDVTVALSKSVPEAKAKATRPTFEELYTEEIATILVGPEKKVFRIYKALLCHEFSFLKAALNSGFKEGLESKVELPEENTRIFQIFFKWIITLKVFHDDVLKVSENIVKLKHLVKTYLLADRLGVPPLMNLCIDIILASHSQSEAGTQSIVAPKEWPITFLYKATLPGSALRRLIVDLIVWSSPVPVAAEISILPAEYVAELMEAYHKRPTPFKESDAPYHIDLCQYHQHQPGERCPKK